MGKPKTLKECTSPEEAQIICKQIFKTRQRQRHYSAEVEPEKLAKISRECREQTKIKDFKNG